LAPLLAEIAERAPTLGPPEVRSLLPSILSHFIPHLQLPDDMRISLTSSIAASLLCFGSLARAQNASSNATTYAAGLISALQENK